MSKVLVDRELLCQALGGGVKGEHARSELRGMLSRAQPAEAEGMDLQRLAAEFDAAPDDAEWEPPHPIFQMARDLDRVTAALSAVTAERDRLREQVKALQSDANSWQSGYDKGRDDGTKRRKIEIDQLRAEVEASGWIPLTKATPPDGVPVLRWPGWAAEFSIDEWCNDYGCFLMSIEGGERATHWKPLCAPKAAMSAKEA